MHAPSATLVNTKHELTLSRVYKHVLICSCDLVYVLSLRYVAHACLRVLYSRLYRAYISKCLLKPQPLTHMNAYMNATETPSSGVTQQPSYELEHIEAYLNMVCYVSKTPVHELVVQEADTTAQEEEEEMQASTFGHNFPTLSSASSKSSKSSNADTDISAHQVLQNQKTVIKSVSLLHTEGIVWQSIVHHHRNATIPLHETLGVMIFQIIPHTVISLTPLLDLLCQANLDLDFHAIIYHIASMVALQHYIRLTVMRTGQFAPQRVINMQQSYYRTLLFGLYNIHLTDAQRQYIQKYTRSPC